MKGLLRKDFYMMIRYCRTMLLILILFLGVSFVNVENFFFSIYPCLLCSMIPITLLSYDERSHWNQYSLTMPYTRSQLVGSKYLIGLIVNVVVVLVSLAVAAARTIAAGETLTAAGILSLGAAMLAASLTVPGLCLPWIFKLGVEKGRMAFYGVIVVIFGGAAVLTASGVEVSLNMGGHWILAIMAALFAASWALSAAFVKNKEY